MEDHLTQYFPELDPKQVEALLRLETAFREWNSRMNLVSRKDMDHFVLHHLIHSLALTKWIRFPDRTRVLDVGTGGGLPGMPLSILNPRVSFFLCDSIAKKAKAVQEMVTTLGLKNATVINKRAETLESKWEFILGRAVTSLPTFIGWIRKNIRAGGNAELPNGILYWKGSLYKEELEKLGIEPFAVYPIEERIPDPYFSEKYIIHLTREQAMQARLPEEDAASPGR
ncbi:MAG TPA: 16S rRNA (guanine(527)-N(7))-methyltransferase RsmG [Oceanipulchritudo sp.]|nr:16S rRNA (guanine(527)-N(7))-methyltransferase RsmG [Oceanipulchritudo sp.]